MKTKMKLLKLSISVLLLFAIAFSICSCNLESEFVTGELEALGIPEFDHAKFKGVELVYRDYYVEELPEASLLAEKTAAIYFEKYHSNTDTSDKTSVTDALIDSYLEVIGDKYSVYRSAEEYEDYGTDMSGSFYGIGITVSYDREHGTLKILDVTNGGGAYDAGILTNDIIIRVDDIDITTLEYDKVINMVRGELDTRVKITVLRDGTELTFDVVRKKVVEQSVTYSLGENGIGYIKISSFKSNTYSQFKTAIDYMKTHHASGIVYDLRSNPGGRLDAVVNMLSYIAPTGATIVSFSNDYAVPRRDSNIYSLALPSVVICNGDTASAGELFTAAMRDYGDLGYFDVTTVGTVTYGKGVMQNTYEFTDNSAITLTVAYYNPPSGVNYHGVGITPDVTVEKSDTGDVQLETAYAEMTKLLQKQNEN